MALSGKDVCDEVAFRINGRLSASATGAGSIINYTNDVLGLISSAASWTWDTTTFTNTAAADRLVLTNCDSGKAIAAFNSNGTIISRADQGEDESLSVGYVNVQPIYNHYRLSADTGGLTYEPYLYFYPLAGGLPVVVRAHLRPPVLVYNTTPTVRWLYPEMDALLKDWTEAMCCRVLKMVGWQALWQDCQGRIGEFKQKWSTERINTGPTEGITQVAEEKQIGRA